MCTRVFSLLLASMLGVSAVAAPPKQLSSTPAQLAARAVKANDALPKALRRSASAIAFDVDGIRSRAATGTVKLEGFPLGPVAQATLELKSVDMGQVASQVVIAQARGESTVVPPRALVLTGGVEGDDKSFAFLALSAAGNFGCVETQGRTWIISSGPYGAGLPTLAYELDALPEGAINWSNWVCETLDPEEFPQASAFAEGGVASTPCREFRLAFETDHEFLQFFGGDIEAATGYVQTIVAALNTIYSRDLNARISSSFLRLWVDPADPWTATSAAGQLYEFRNSWIASMGYVQRDTAQFLSGRALGGGIAYLNGLCNTNGYAVSSNLNGFFPYPLLNNSSQNWDIFVVAHELGHNLGAPHTHAYSPALDGCGASPPDCSVGFAKQGTIMSYCHLCGGGMQNIRLEFHPGNIETMDAYISALGCDYSGLNSPPVAIADAASGFAATQIRVDVLANDAASNCDSLTIVGFDSVSAMGASVSRSIGTGAEGRDELIYTHGNPNFAGADSFSYTLGGSSPQHSIASVTVAVTALRAPENPIGSVSQLDARYYAIPTLSALPNFAAMTPTVSNAVNAINFVESAGAFATSGMSDHVAAVFEGWITIPTSGAWGFSLASDEGSRMYLGDEVVIDNDGAHTMLLQNATVGLQAGMHAFRLEYFENTGSAGCVLSWAPPTGLPAAVPASAFARGGSDEVADFNNDGAIGAADLTILLSHWGELNPAFDLNASGRVDSGDLTILLNDWTG